MPVTTIELPDEPAAAAARLREASRERAVLVFKKSPVCPVSFHAESEYREFLSELGEATDLAVVEIDVIARRPLARGLTAELGIRHESPQALLFRAGELVWHDSHEALSVGNFRAKLA
ncbi:MAG: DUF2847 family protein [Planctomycetes bacterium]|nr:DUF2847 family protein [Planctomycetota bacterium]